MDIYCDDLVAKVLENESNDAAAGRDAKRAKKQGVLAAKPPSSGGGGGGKETLSGRNDSLKRPSHCPIVSK